MGEVEKICSGGPFGRVQVSSISGDLTDVATEAMRQVQQRLTASGKWFMVAVLPALGRKIRKESDELWIRS